MTTPLNNGQPAQSETDLDNTIIAANDEAADSRAMAQESPVYREVMIGDGKLESFIARTIGGADCDARPRDSERGTVAQQFFTLDSARKSLASARKGASVP